MGHACQMSSVLKARVRVHGVCMACSGRVHAWVYMSMGARLFVVVQVDVAEQAGAIARRPALVLWHRLRSSIAKEQDERGDVGVGRGEQREELSVERGPVVRLLGASCHHGRARRRVN